jgi:hypothetical protein
MSWWAVGTVVARDDFVDLHINPGDHADVLQGAVMRAATTSGLSTCT